MQYAQAGRRSLQRCSVELDGLLSLKSGPKYTDLFVQYLSGPCVLAIVRDTIRVMTEHVVTSRELLHQCTQWRRYNLEVIESGLRAVVQISVEQCAIHLACILPSNSVEKCPELFFVICRRTALRARLQICAQQCIVHLACILPCNSVHATQLHSDLTVFCSM